MSLTNRQLDEDQALCNAAIRDDPATFAAIAVIRWPKHIAEVRELRTREAMQGGWNNWTTACCGAIWTKGNISHGNVTCVKCAANKNLREIITDRNAEIGRLEIQIKKMHEVGFVIDKSLKSARINRLLKTEKCPECDGDLRAALNGDPK